MIERTVYDFTMHPQELVNLCWAAVALSVDIWRDQPGHWTNLCEVVSDALNNPACCSSLSSSQCNVPGEIKETLILHGRFGGRHPTPNLESRDRIWKDIKHEIDAGRVVCATIRRQPSRVLHIVVICGYAEDTTTKRLSILDPWENPIDMPYVSFLTDFRYEGGQCIRLTTVQ